MKTILSKEEMKNVAGGVSREEYCQTLANILINNDLDEGACEGATIGAENAGCNFTPNC